jgi:hypothetical protein
VGVCVRAGHLKKIFQMIDKDGNGMITIEELRTAAEQVHAHKAQLNSCQSPLLCPYMYMYRCV